MIRTAAMTMTLLFAGLFAGAALADGDAAKGEALTAKRCKACHTISNGDEVLLKGGKTGPNLYGVIGRAARAGEDFKYGDDIIAAGEKGLVWDEAQIAAYIEDPRTFLRAYLDDGKARSKMVFKLRDEDDRADVAAYLASIGVSP
ncbi:MAG: c-type cytochrome [Paracoccaceae bacterium]